MDFSERLRLAIGRTGFLVREIASRAGVEKRTLDKWLSKTKPTIPNVIDATSVATVLGVTVEYLVTGTDSTDPWIRENRDLIANLKELNAEDLEEISAIVKIKANRQIARDLQSGLGS